MTAKHVAEPMLSDREIYFEATMQDDGLVDGVMVQDKDSQGIPLNFTDRIYPGYDTKFQDWEENPLLANRLVQLGLEDLAYQAEVRDYLRGPWPFEVETDQSGDSKEFPSLFVQGQNIILDVSVLQTGRRTDSNDSPPAELRNLDTGTFPLRAPGVFFDYRPYSSLQYMACPQDSQYDNSSNCPGNLVPNISLWPEMPSNSSQDSFDELWLLHHNYYPGDRDQPVHRPPHRTPLISNPYTTNLTPDEPVKGVRHIYQNGSNIITTYSDLCVEATQNETYEFADQFPVSLDSFPGSSGGPMMFNNKVVWHTGGVNHFDRQINPTAVASSTSIEDPQHPGNRGWGLPEEDFEDQDLFVLVTAISDEVSDWSRRDDSDDSEDDPFNPSPVQPPDDGEPRCKRYESDGRTCAEYYTTTVENDAFDFPNGPVFDWPGYIDPRQADRDEANAEGNGTRRVICGRSHQPFTSNDEDTRLPHAGLGMGFIGSLRYDPDDSDVEEADENSVVGYLRMVCAPWSSEPFVINWPFLRTAGTSLSNTSRHTGVGFIDWLGSLPNTLATLAEVRHQHSGGEPYMRPLSMMTCPPNYLLTEVYFQNDPHPTDNTERVLAGIMTLGCTQSTNPPEGENIPIHIKRHLHFPDGEPCLNTMAGECFSLSQAIGRSKNEGMPECDEVQAPAQCQEHTSCPSGQVANGFSYQRTGDGLITGFKLECIEEPG